MLPKMFQLMRHKIPPTLFYRESSVDDVKTALDEVKIKIYFGQNSLHVYILMCIYNCMYFSYISLVLLTLKFVCILLIS